MIDRSVGRRGPVLAAVLSFLFTAGAVSIGEGPAVAATVGTPTRIVGGQSGRCLDVPNSATTNGLQTQLYDCSGTRAGYPCHPARARGITRPCGSRNEVHRARS
jgi:hypothetical protein